MLHVRTRRVALLSLALSVSSCASRPPAVASAPPKPVETVASEPVLDAPADESNVLGKKKCPKHSHLVEGRCLMEVESDN